MGAVAPIEVELRDRCPRADEERRVGQSEVARGMMGDELRLVVAALARPVLVDGYMGDEVRPDSGRRPPSCDRLAERLAEPLLPAVLDGVERVADHAVEWGAPVELEEGLGQLPGKADRGPRRTRQASIEGRLAVTADRRPFRAATHAGRWQCRVEGAGCRRPHDGEGRHGRIGWSVALTRDVPVSHPALYRVRVILAVLAVLLVSVALIALKVVPVLVGIVLMVAALFGVLAIGQRRDGPRQRGYADPGAKLDAHRGVLPTAVDPQPGDPVRTHLDVDVAGANIDRGDT